MHIYKICGTYATNMHHMCIWWLYCISHENMFSGSRAVTFGEANIPPKNN